MTYKFFFIILGISLISCQSDNSKPDNNLSLGGFNYQDDVVTFYTSNIVDQVQFKVRINDKVRFSSYYCNANDYIMFDQYKNHTCSEWITDWDPREYTTDGNVVNFDGGSITFLSRSKIRVTFTGIKQSPHLMDTKVEV